MDNTKDKEVDVKKIAKVAAYIIISIICITIITNLATFFLMDSEIRYYTIRYEYGMYYVRAEVKHGNNFVVHATTDSKEAMEVLDRFNNKRREVIIEYKLPNASKIPKVPSWEDFNEK